MAEPGPVAEPPRHHLLIAGTGRAGTSALVRLLSVCGLDTVSRDGDVARWHPEANAGAESAILREASMPYVIKSPWTYQYIDELLDDETIILDRVIIPIRRLASASESRLVTEMHAQNLRERILLNYKSPWNDYGQTPGGAINSFEPIDQERILGRSLHLLIEALEERDVPMTFLSFPRFVADVDYTWERLRNLFPDIRKPAFKSVFSKVISQAQVRVESEMHRARTYSPPPREGAANSVTDLRVASLLREIDALKAASKETSLENPLCTDPDAAPDGLSHGDTVLGAEGLQGWQWNTVRRPEDPSYGYQTAHSDTADLSLIRRLSGGRWSAWRPLG